MRNIRALVTAATLLLTCVFAASAQATSTNFTSSNVTSPADGTLLFQDWYANPNATITVAGTTNWTASEPAICSTSAATTAASPIRRTCTRVREISGLRARPGWKLLRQHAAELFGGAVLPPRGGAAWDHSGPGNQLHGPARRFQLCHVRPGCGWIAPDGQLLVRRRNDPGQLPAATQASTAAGSTSWSTGRAR